MLKIIILGAIFLIGVYLLRKKKIHQFAISPIPDTIPTQETKRVMIMLTHMEDQDIKSLAAANNDKGMTLAMCSLYGDPLSVNYIMGKAITEVDCEVYESSHSALVKVYYT